MEPEATARKGCNAVACASDIVTLRPMVESTALAGAACGSSGDCWSGDGVSSTTTCRGRGCTGSGVSSGWRKASKLACIASKVVRSDSKSWKAAESEPMRSMSDSILWAISPRRMAPASRALPLRVWSARRTSLRAPRLVGRADHCRRAAPNCGINSAPSSSKMENRSGSMASTASNSSSMSSAKAAAEANLEVSGALKGSGIGSAVGVGRACGRGSGTV